MKWKICLIACVNIFFLILPYNIIGCGPEADPYDYYTSFFLSNLAGVSSYRPFLYSSELFLYDQQEPEDAAHATADEWIAYSGNRATHRQAYDFVCRFGESDLGTLYKNITQKEHVSLPDSVARNPITQYFERNRDLEGLTYLMYAKKAEPQVTGRWDEWNAPKRDSVQMDQLIREGTQLYKAAKKPFIKLRYGYQITRLALYSGHIKDCIRYYDDMIAPNPSRSILHDLGTSLKAGALLKSGKNYEAALLFSREFSKSRVKRVSNYMSFDWCVKRLDSSDRTKCLELCKTSEEKANLLGLFALGSINGEEATLRQIYSLDPKAELLGILAVREINKIEENFFSPQLSARKGGSTLYYTWSDDETSGQKEAWLQEAKSLVTFYDSLAHDPAIGERALFETGAAYLSYVTRNYEKGMQYLDKIPGLHPTEKIRDQAALTRLLITINEHQKIDSSFENALLPSIEWLREKAVREKEGEQVNPNGYEDWITPWHKFYRDLFSQVLAKRYHNQKEMDKEVLCIGDGEAITAQHYSTEDFLENDMETRDLMALYQLMHATKKPVWEQYLCKHFPLSINKVREVIAVSYIRDYRFSLAIRWLSHIDNREMRYLPRNPFADLLIDNQDSIFSFDKGNSFSKIAFLKEMERLTQKEKQHKATGADLYRLGLGYYNMTYYGRAWELVSYGRSGADGYYIPKNSLPYQREYYGCFTAEKYFQRALKAYRDKNDQGRCLFMIAKCVQKRNPEQPDYFYGYDVNSKGFHDFKYSKYFPRLVQQYGKTPFFREAFNTCSYLRDFVRKK